MAGRTIVVLLVASFALAGCSESPSEHEGEAGESNDAAGMIVQRERLSFGSPGEAIGKSFSGEFEFTDNDQFAGGAQRRLGGEPDNMHEHDISSLLPAQGLYLIHASVNSDPGGGDIDVGIADDGQLLTSWCDCPFGGENSLYAYAIGGGSMDVTLMYDEISSGPDDFDVALQGFTYEIEVVIIPLAFGAAPGVPIAVELDVGDKIEFDNHTQEIVIFNPDDQEIAIIGPSDSSLEVAGNLSAGEYVLIQRVDGSIYDIHLTRADATSAARILPIVTESELEAIPTGEPAEVEFTAPPGLMQIGACAFAGDASLNPSFEVIDPDGDVWASRTNVGLVPLGWGTCSGTWSGSSGHLPGEWTIRAGEDAGEGMEIFWTIGAFKR